MVNLPDDNWIELLIRKLLTISCLCIWYRRLIILGFMISRYYVDLMLLFRMGIVMGTYIHDTVAYSEAEQ